MGEIRQLEQYYRLNQAADLDGFMTAMSLNALPSINYIYADRQANVAFIHNAQYPARDDAWDWSGDMPGDRSDLIWNGYRPWSDVPKLVNPVSGLIYNSNNTPYSATDGPDNLHAEDFPQSMGLQTNESNRSLRIIELTDGTTPINEPDLMALKFDTSYAKTSEAADLIARVVAIDWSREPEMAEAAKRLAAWDMNMNADSRYAALGGLTVLREITAKYTHIPAPKPETAFREAVEWLTVHHGRIDPEWGEVNRLVRGHVSLPISGGPDTLRAVYPDAMRDDGELHMTAGDTWIALVEWDRQGHQVARVINPYGSASLDKASPHYADQAPLFVAEEWRKAHLTREDVLANATRTYHPGRD
jgi:penicillin amidase/acyl-homoserine-lactone acylase